MNRFEPKPSSGWVEIPEKFESEYVPNGVADFSATIAGASVKITSIGTEAAVKISESSKIHKIVDGQLVSVDSSWLWLKNMVRARVRDWKNFRDHAGNDVVITEAAKAEAIVIPGFAGFVRHYGEILDKISAGEAEEQEKNLFKSPDGFPAAGKKRTKAGTASNAANSGQKG